jgi:hypothetical protein
MNMRILVIFVLLLSLVSVVLAEGENEAQIIAYYFHGNFRCPSCYRIEQYTKQAIEQYFKDEINSGDLVFKPINFDKKENKHFIKDYQLYTKSVVISLVKNGKEIKYNNLSEVWNYLGDKEQFFNYIKSEVGEYLKETR